MTPAHPPLPTAWNLPFQFAAGSQISTLMSESAVGVSVAATRQNSGALNSFPAGTTSARVIAVPFRLKAARPAQGMARAGAAAVRSAAARMYGRIGIESFLRMPEPITCVVSSACLSPVLRSPVARRRERVPIARARNADGGSPDSTVLHRLHECAHAREPVPLERRHAGLRVAEAVLSVV